MILFLRDQIDHVTVALDRALSRLPLGLDQVLDLLLLRVCLEQQAFLILPQLVVFQKIIKNLLADPDISKFICHENHLSLSSPSHPSAQMTSQISYAPSLRSTQIRTFEHRMSFRSPFSFRIPAKVTVPAFSRRSTRIRCTSDSSGFSSVSCNSISLS